MLSYVDDLLARASRSEAEWFYQELSKRFECKDPQWLEPGKPLDHIGMVIFQTQKGVYLSLESYIKTVLVKLNMEDAIGLKVHTPIRKLIEAYHPSAPSRQHSSCRPQACCAGWPPPGLL